MSILGNRVVRVEDPGLLTGATPFVADIHDPLLDGALHATYVRSVMAHARILSVDVEEARSMPGVIGIFTATDLGLVPLPSPFAPPFTTCPLAYEVVRFVGEPIAVVVTESADQGEDAAEMVVVDYEPLPVVLDPFASADHETLLFPEIGTNVCGDSTMMGMPGERDDLFDGIWAQYPRKKEIFRACMRESVPMPESVKQMLLGGLDGLAMAVVSSSGRLEVEGALELVGVRQAFQTVVTGEDVRNLKPSPEPYQTAAARLGIARALVVEDSVAGIASGEAAGFEVLQVDSAHRTAELVRQRLGLA